MSRGGGQRVRLEADVGITLTLSNHPRLSARIKDRYSDFHVNEIHPDGTRVRLTSLDPPKDERPSEGSTDPQILTLIPEGDRERVVQLQGRLLSADKRDLRPGGQLGKEAVDIKVTSLDKESRTRIHRWISSFDKLSSETVEKDGDKFIKIIPLKGNPRMNRRPAHRAKYTHCVLYKEGVETGEAIGFLSSKLNMKPSLFSYAGIKDKRAKTCQRLAISNIDPGRLVGISKYARNGIKLGNFSSAAAPIALGELSGNHFKLLLKDIKFPSDLHPSKGSLPDDLPDLESAVSLAVSSLSTLGFINYYGLQRFGSYAISTYHVGREILRQNWIKAFDLLLSPKPGDHPSMASAKKMWSSQRDPTAALKLLPSRAPRSIESALLHGLARNYARNDFVGVFTSLPRHSRLLYVHAYQSLLWNRGASRRIQEYGVKGPVLGDLVFEGEGAEEEIVELEGDDFGGAIKEESSAPMMSSSLRNKQEVRTLTQEDVDGGKYSIYDVLLPLFGAEVKYPDNRMKDILLGILEEEGIGPDSFTNFRPISDKPTGGYRKLIVRPTNVSRELRKYSVNEDLDKFIPSDLDLLLEEEKMALNKKKDEESLHKDKEIPVIPEVDQVPEDKKDKTCLILEFSLPSSSYATMALRELLVEDVGQISDNQKETNLESETIKNSSINLEDESPPCKKVKADPSTN